MDTQFVQASGTTAGNLNKDASSPAQSDLDARIAKPLSDAEHIDLDETSWIEHTPLWVENHEQLFDLVAATAGWEQRTRRMWNKKFDEPRLTAEYPDLTQASAALQQLGAALTGHFDVEYDSVWINQYRSHRDSTGWHGDWPSCKRSTAIVPVLSLGATRRFLIRPKDGGKSLSIPVAGGDIIVMGGRAQIDYRHSVPKQTREAGPRISVNYGSSFQATSER